MPDPLPWPELDPIPAGWLDDTPPSAIAALRALTPARRLATSRALLRTARGTLAAGVRLRMPHLTPEEVAAEVRTAIARVRA